MNSFKRFAGLLWLGAMTLMTSCQTGSVPRDVSAPPAEILRKQYLYEIARYLYSWQLDESEIKGIFADNQVVFWVQRLHPPLDAGDNSVLAMIFLPQLHISAKVKKADYRFEELGVPVKGRSFRITRVTRGDVPRRRPVDAVEVKMPLQELRDYLFDTRNQRDYPDADLIERLRAAVRKQAADEGRKSTNAPATNQVIYVAPLFPVANEVWVFWENRLVLFHFASDIDLSNPVVWDYESLMVRIFDIDEQVVGSHEEAPGSNRFLTRTQVGRVLYNCVVLGQKIILPPRGP